MPSGDLAKRRVLTLTHGGLFPGIFIRSEFDEADEFCPNCDNHFIIEGTGRRRRNVEDGLVTCVLLSAEEPVPMIAVEAEDERIDSRLVDLPSISGCHLSRRTVSERIIFTQNHSGPEIESEKGGRHCGESIACEPLLRRTSI